MQLSCLFCYDIVNEPEKQSKICEGIFALFKCADYKFKSNKEYWKWLNQDAEFYVINAVIARK